MAAAARVAAGVGLVREVATEAEDAGTSNHFRQHPPPDKVPNEAVLRFPCRNGEYFSDYGPPAARRFLRLTAFCAMPWR